MRDYLQDKHMGACSKAKKPRKTYDATKARVKGTELEQYASKAKANGMLDDRKVWRLTKSARTLASLC